MSAACGRTRTSLPPRTPPARSCGRCRSRCRTGRRRSLRKRSPGGARSVAPCGPSSPVILPRRLQARRAHGVFCYVPRMRRAVGARRPGGRLLPALVLFLASTSARAADEIQVYNAEINRPGQFSLQLHGNYVPRGRTTAEFPGGLVPDGAFNGTPALALGVTDFWEVGAYLPYAVTRGGDFETGGGKLRTLLASPRAHERRFFYGVNFELSHQPRLFVGNHWSSEIRPIIGWRRRPIEFIVNPIVDVVLSGPRRTIDFAPAARLACILSPAWAVGLEHYA